MIPAKPVAMADDPLFVLDPRIAAGSAPVARLGLCEVRLQLDARWPWLVLVPQRAGLSEIEALPPQDRSRLMEEAVAAGRAVRALGEARGRSVEKLNIGALGNIVAQLHLHVVGRCCGDPAWPGPVWGFGVAEVYPPSALQHALTVARDALDAA